MEEKVTGTILTKCPVVSGTSQKGTWAKQEFVVGYKSGDYDKKKLLVVWGEDHVNRLKSYKIGEVVTVSYDSDAREYNGRWFGENRAWKIVAEGDREQAPAPAPTEGLPDPDGDLPF